MPPRIPSAALPKRVSPVAIFNRFYSAPASEALLTVTNIPSPSSGHIRVLELNRPKARNAISKNLLATLRAEIDDVMNQYGPYGEEIGNYSRGNKDMGPTRALVLASAVDSCFCAGADLKERKTFTQEEYAIPYPLHSSSFEQPNPHG
jgi:methylglutaconyl-CoA hydratase